MQAQTIDARIVLTSLAIVFALVVAVTPRIATANDGAELTDCRTERCELHHDRIKALNAELTDCKSERCELHRQRSESTTAGNNDRGTSGVVQPVIIPGTLTDYLFMEQNMWGADFEFAPAAAPYLPSPANGASTDSQITSF